MYLVLLRYLLYQFVPYFWNWIAAPGALVLNKKKL